MQKGFIKTPSIRKVTCQGGYYNFTLIYSSNIPFDPLTTFSTLATLLLQKKNAKPLYTEKEKPFVIIQGWTIKLESGNVNLENKSVVPFVGGYLKLQGLRPAVQKLGRSLIRRLTDAQNPLIENSETL